MLRISKLTDYGIVVMAYLASHKNLAHNAKQIAHNIHIALPTVSKLLKLLTRQGLLNAQRGVKGGYSLAQPADSISIATIIAALEGDLGLTECSHKKSNCAVESRCAIRNNWQIISNAIETTLSKITLAEMTQPLSKKHILSSLN